MASPAKRRRLLHSKLKRALFHERKVEAVACHYCDRLLRFREVTLDHKLPRSRGGRTVLGNLVLSCDACNQDKSDLTCDEYLRRRRAA